AESDRHEFEPLIQQQAAKRLEQSQALKHATLKEFRAYYMAFAKDIGADVGSRRFGAAATRLSAEASNVRKAWRVEEDVGALYDYAAALSPYMERNGQWDDLTELSKRALDRGGDDPGAAGVRYTLATVLLN